MTLADLAATPPQRARRDRMLRAAVELASGGYDAVQMRDVAERAGVALGTLYRYFPSKVHLLVAAQAEELERLQERVRDHGTVEGDAVDRIMLVLSRVTRGMGRNRDLSAALVRAVMFADATVGPDVDRVRATMESIISWATHGADEPPTEEDALVASIVSKVWLSDIVQWLGDRMTLTEVLDDLRRTLERVLPVG